jgi:hypothetical protein
MPASKGRSSGILLVLAGALASAPPAHAAGLFDFLFGPPRPSYNRPSPSFLPLPEREPAPRRRRPDLRLPHATASKPPVPTEAKPARAAPPAELVAQILADPTLERGDIVIFPEGPRVYRGKAGYASHQLSDFEPVETSALVPKSTREAVIASGGPNAVGRSARADSRRATGDRPKAPGTATLGTELARQ